MEKFDIYKDVAKRSGGDIYIGVVGPVRTGKSTFITKFMDYMVTPNILNKQKLKMAIDEMPQSGSGKTITTTEPKFVPAEGVKISVGKKAQAKVRLIDCVGYMVEGALGGDEDGAERLVKPPWSTQPMPLKKAAEIGTEKVFKDHSTVGVLVTTDGSVCDIPRENYIEAEERVVEDLRKCGKPFVIVLNTADKNGENAQKLADSLTDKYGVKVIKCNLLEVGEDGLNEILENLLLEFPLKTFDVTLPKWLQVLPSDSPIILDIVNKIKDVAPIVSKMKHYKVIEDALSSVDSVETVSKSVAMLDNGSAKYDLKIKDGLFYDTLSQISGDKIESDYELISYVKELCVAKNNYRKLKSALSEVDEGGYGIVIPENCDMTLSEPEVIRQGGRYGVKIKANTSCMHLLKIGLSADVSPISGTEKQCRDFAEFLKNEYQENPEKVWKTDVFGKQLCSLVSEEIMQKIGSMRQDTKNKMRKTVTRIVNEGKGGVICILL